MSGHTPGPWHRCGHDRGGCSCGLVWSLASDTPVADVSFSCDEEARENRASPEERKANALLIANAPCLLDAHQNTLDALSFLQVAVLGRASWKELEGRVSSLISDTKFAIVRATQP